MIFFCSHINSIYRYHNCHQPSHQLEEKKDLMENPQAKEDEMLKKIVYIENQNTSL